MLGGTVSSDGGATVTEKGVCYNTSPNPTIANTKLVIGSGNGEFSNTVSGLLPNTNYYVKAYAVNSQGNTYGAEVSFTTSAISLSVSPVIFNIAKEAGSRVFTVSSNIDWQVSSDQAWCKLNLSSGEGNSLIVATFEANTSVGQRSAALTFSGVGVSNQMAVISQEGKEPPVLSITPANQNVTSTAGITSFTITSNIAWTATVDQTWCTIANSSGLGNGALTINYDTNTGNTQRVATVSVTGLGLSVKTLTIVQNTNLKNVALANSGASASAISVGSYLGITYPAVNAIDGDSLSYWASNWSMPGWLQVQFDKTYTISKVGVWFGQHKHTYSISLSIDGINWNVVVPSRLSTNKEQDTPKYEIFNIPLTSARYIKCDITTTSAPGSHIFQSVINDLEAYGY